jgi:hypothetical protein
MLKYMQNWIKNIKNLLKSLYKNFHSFHASDIFNNNTKEILMFRKKLLKNFQ